MAKCADDKHDFGLFCPLGDQKLTMFCHTCGLEFGEEGLHQRLIYFSLRYPEEFIHGVMGKQADGKVR